MDGEPERVAARRYAKKMMEKARAWEAMTGQPDGTAYKTAALAMHRALLLEKLWNLDRQGNNAHRRRKTLDRLAFLRGVIREDQALSEDPEALVAEVLNKHTRKALELWPQRWPQVERKLASAIEQFLRENIDPSGRIRMTR